MCECPPACSICPAPATNLMTRTAGRSEIAPCPAVPAFRQDEERWVRRIPSGACVFSLGLSRTMFSMRGGLVLLQALAKEPQIRIFPEKSKRSAFCNSAPLVRCFWLNQTLAPSGLWTSSVGPLVLCTPPVWMSVHSPLASCLLRRSTWRISECVIGELAASPLT